MEVLILWAIAGGKQTLQEFTTLLGLTAKSSILTMYIRPMEEAGFISRDRLSSGRAPHHSLRLTAKGIRRLSEYAILRYKDRLEIYQVVARYGEGGELEEYV
jgi:DNA-binding HxlR family transcriptional regulator